MKRRSFLILGLCLFLICVVGTGKANAASTLSAPITEEISPERKTKYLKAINLSTSYTEPDITYITGFDVNDEGILAVESQISTNYKAVHLYDHNQTFLCSYIFQCQGNFDVKWETNTLCLYPSRAQLIVTIDLTDNSLDVFGFPLDSLENREYTRLVLHARERTYQGETYWLDDKVGPIDIYLGSYSKLIRTSEDGVETVLLDVSEAKTKRILGEFGFAVLFFIVVVVNLFFTFRKYRNQRQNKNPFRYLNDDNLLNSQKKE